MTDIVFLYSTAPDEATARRIASALIEARAAACVNLFPGMVSLYRWKGAVETADEVAMIVKTTAGAAAAARRIVLASHPYDTPCIVAFPAAKDGGNPAFSDWIARSVSE